MPSSSPSSLLAERRALTLAERLHAKLVDAELAALDLPPVGVAAVVPNAAGTLSPALCTALADYVLGALHRAGLAAAFRALLVNDALETRDAALCQLVGARQVSEPNPGGPPVLRWVLPPDVPPLPNAELLARELAGRLVAAESARAETAAQPAEGVRHA
jgi:hypothetical protein